MPFGLYLRPQVTPFVILFIERDGSTYMISMLESHPAIATVYERFAVMRQKGEDAAAQLAWARDFYSAPLIGSTGAIGFKTKLVDVLDLDGFAALLQEKQVHVIQMQRRNRVKAVISRINARRLYEATGNWNLYDKSDRMPPMHVKPELFAGYLREREEADEQLDAYVAALGLPTLRVTYEELLVNRDAVLRQIFSFLQIAPHPVQEKTIKHTKDDLREVVENFDALRAHYAGTPYEAMFDELLTPATAAPAH